MLSINDFYKNESDYLKASDIPVGKKVRLTIERVGRVTFNEGKSDQKIKICISFVGKKKKFAANKTNSLIISSVLGDDAEQWPGKEIFLFTGPVSMGDKMVPGLKVEMPMEEAGLAAESAPSLNQGSSQPIQQAAQQPAPQQQPAVVQQQQPTQSAPLQGQTNQATDNFDDFDQDIPF